MTMAVGPPSPTLLKSILSLKSEFLRKIYALFFQRWELRIWKFWWWWDQMMLKDKIFIIYIIGFFSCAYCWWYFDDMYRCRLWGDTLLSPQWSQTWMYPNSFRMDTPLFTNLECSLKYFTRTNSSLATVNI